MPESYYVTSFYAFFEVTKLEGSIEDLKTQLENICKQSFNLGLVILAPEGINAALASPSRKERKKLEDWLETKFQRKFDFKRSQSPQAPFRRFHVKIRREIITRDPQIQPLSSDDSQLNGSQLNGSHLTPREWNEALKKEDGLLMDVRNWYEVKIGKFKKAILPQIQKFTDFPRFLDQQKVPKDKKILIYCTGGVRCEKEVVSMKKKGYKNVYQLQGGILKYLEEFPNDEFEGECFVFDQRVALDQNLQPSQKYKLCPHTGQPADVVIHCKRCDSPVRIASEVKGDPIKGVTCSKNCAHHYSVRPRKKGPRQELSL